jgi:signal transduction histidine kinase
VDLAELAAAEAARPRSKRVITTLQPGVLVDGDRLRLSRLITNLLDNAERHAESTIIVTVRKDGDASLEVLDDGAGIAPEHRERVFERFTRLDASRSRDAGGTGLGLPIAREIARAHGGTLTIEDSDRGARFVLRLPLRSD